MISSKYSMKAMNASTMEVIDTFRNSSGPVRLELMSKLLRTCLPLELRFIGSCLEDLAKKDYHFLREDEIKANDLAELTKWSENFTFNDGVSRAKLGIYLALLHSSNVVCSNVLHGTLSKLESSLRSMESLPPYDEVMLLLTMAAYHPAFTFIQRQCMYDQLMAVQRLYEEQAPQEVEYNCRLQSHYHGTGHCGGHSYMHGNPSANGCVTPARKPLYVCDLELKASQQRTVDHKHEFTIQVTWCDGRISEVTRTYQELHTFHTELIELFPKDAGAHKQDRQIPFFPQDKGSQHAHLQEQIKKYLRQLCKLPKHISQCEHVSGFFRSLSSPSSSPASLSCQVSSLSAQVSSLTLCPQPVCHHSPNVSSPDKGECITSSPHLVTTTSSIVNITSRSALTSPGSYTSTYSSPQTSPCISPAASPLGQHHSPLHQDLMSPHLSHLHDCQHSPQHGVVSPHHSPLHHSSHHEEVSPRNHNPSLFDPSSWLKKNRLHKYEAQLSKFTLEQLMGLSEKDLEKAGLTAGARRKFLTEVHKLRAQYHRPNGLVDAVSVSSGRSASPSSPVCHSPQMYYIPAADEFTETPEDVPTLEVVMATQHQQQLSSSSASSSPGPSHHTPPDSHNDKEYEGEGGEEEADDYVHLSQLGDQLLPPGIKAPPYPMPVQPHTSTNMFMPIGGAGDMKGVDLMAMQYPAGVRPMLIPGLPEHYLHHQLFFRGIRPPIRPPKMMHTFEINSTIPPKLPTPPMASQDTQTDTKPPNFIHYQNMSKSQSPPTGPPRPTTLGLPTTSIINNPVTFTVAPAIPPLIDGPKNGTVIHTGPHTAITINTDTLPQYTMYGTPSYQSPTLPPSTQSGPQNISHVPLVQAVVHPVSGPVNPVSHVVHPVNGPVGAVNAAGQPVNGPVTQQGQPAPVNGPIGQPVNQPVASGNVPTQLNGPIPPVNGLVGPHPTATSSPVPPALTPTQPATPVGTAQAPSCSACGCNGHCTNTVQYNYMWRHPVLPTFPYGILPASNGLVNQALPFPNIPLPNGMTPELYPGYLLQHPLPGFPVMNPSPAHSSTTSSTGSSTGDAPSKPRPHSDAPTKIHPSLMCSNCGSKGHTLLECRSPSMESITHSGQYHLNLCSKSDSE